MGLFSPTFETLRDLYLNELRDLYSAETQLLEALPKMADAASSSELKEAFTAHLTETEGHVSRLEEIFEALGEEPSGETCKAMEGLIEEGEDYVKASGDKQVRDAGLIGAAQRVEHYEMAGYGTTRTLATRLGESEAADKLQATLEEEEEADRKFTAIAESDVNPAASHRSDS
jgi:ferritin-like metal-binding protein YciE